MVRYQIQYKMIHPKTFSPITNKTLANFEQDKLSDVPAGEKDPKYDMFFYCSDPAIAGGDGLDKFEHVQGEVWVVHSIQHSLKGATSVAKKLVSTYGIANVQICKITPIATEIVFEER